MSLAYTRSPSRRCETRDERISNSPLSAPLFQRRSPTIPRRIPADWRASGDFPGGELASAGGTMAPKKRKAVGAPTDDGDGPPAPKKRVRNRASPFAFVKIYENLTEDQKAVVAVMELDSMLDIKCFYLHAGLIKWLARLYVMSTREFVILGRRRIPLDDRSAFRTLGLPIGSDEVFYGVDADVEARLGAILFPDDVSTPFIARVCQLLVDMIASNDTFKQMFVLFLVCTILRPTTRNHINNMVYRVMANIANVTNLNWCKFVVGELHNALSKGKLNKGCLFHM
uniref:Uncharacterized protein n=1 Tax=Avena sativa TaxID=4498 RepID=A0ACD5Z769_AVESA